MTAKAIPIVVSVIADADDVTLFNRLFDEKLTRSIREPGLLERIGPPLADGPLAPSTKLYMHEASFSEAGVVWLKDRSRQDAVARRLDLTPEETFGLLLAFWRSLYPVGLPRVRDKDYGRAVERIAAYKADAAKATGHDADAMRLVVEGRSIRAALDAKRREDDAINRSLARALRPRPRMAVADGG